MSFDFDLVKTLLTSGLFGVLIKINSGKEKFNNLNFNNIFITIKNFIISSIITILLYIVILFLAIYRTTDSFIHAIMFILFGPIWFHVAFLWWYINDYKLVASNSFKIKNSRSSK